MNEQQRLDATFLALADPTRRAILARLSLGEATVQELGEPFALSQPAISKHLKVLERAGLVRAARDGTRRPRTLAPEPLAEASACLERFREAWEQNYQRLDVLLAELIDAATENTVTAEAEERSDHAARSERSEVAPRRTRRPNARASQSAEHPRAGVPKPRTQRNKTTRRKP